MLLEARGVTRIYGGGLLDRDSTVALRDFSLAIDAERPRITAIVGESGSGKTTLARLLLGLVAPTSGQVLYQGRDLHALSGSERRGFRRDIQAIFQDPYGVYNPFYRVDHVLTTPVARFRLAGSRAAASTSCLPATPPSPTPPRSAPPTASRRRTRPTRSSSLARAARRPTPPAWCGGRTGSP